MRRAADYDPISSHEPTGKQQWRIIGSARQRRARAGARPAMINGSSAQKQKRPDRVSRERGIETLLALWQIRDRNRARRSAEGRVIALVSREPRSGRLTQPVMRRAAAHTQESQR